MVGNGDGTCQFGAYGWAGARGHVLHRRVGLEQGFQMAERVFTVARLRPGRRRGLGLPNPMVVLLLGQADPALRRVRPVVVHARRQDARPTQPNPDSETYMSDAETILEFLARRGRPRRRRRHRPDTSLFRDQLLDSMNLTSLIVFLEETFAIKVKPMDIVYENLDTVNHMLAYIERKKATDA